MNDFATLISTVGFPIAMCLLIWYNSNKQNNTVLDHMNKQNKAMQSSLDKNTEAINKMADKIS